MKTNHDEPLGKPLAGTAPDLDLLGSVAAETWMSQDEAGSVGDPQPVKMGCKTSCHMSFPNICKEIIQPPNRCVAGQHYRVFFNWILFRGF